MTTAVMPLIDVQVEWAMHHRWAPGKEPFPSPPITHPVLWLMLDGSAEIRGAKRSWHLSPGLIFLDAASASSLHERYYTLSPQGGEWLSLGLRATTYGQVNLLHALPEPVVWKPREEDRRALEVWMRQLVCECAGTDACTTVNPALLEIYWRQARHGPGPQGFDGNLIAQGLARAVFGLCCRMLGSSGLIREAYQSTPLWLNRAFQHVHKQPSTTISQWASVSGFSTPQFRRLFHQYVGLSPHHYLTQHRLKMARQLLETTELPMGRIAQQVGFESVSHFTRLFKRDCALSPTKYRQALQLPDSR